MFSLPEENDKGDFTDNDILKMIGELVINNAHLHKKLSWYQKLVTITEREENLPEEEAPSDLSKDKQES